MVGAVVAVVLVLGLAALWADGVGPFARSGTTKGPLTFAAARDQVVRDEGGRPGGPWTIIEASGAAASSEVNLTVANLSASSLTNELESLGCVLTLVPGAPSAYTLPARPVGATNGSLDGWEFGLRSANNTLLIVLDVDGDVEPVGTLAGGECGILLAFLSAVPTSGLVDSPTAVANALAAGGREFLQSHPTANLTATVIGGAHLGSGPLGIGPRWMVALSTCALGAFTTVTGALWNATVGADGSVLNTSSTPLTCDYTATQGLGIGALAPPGTPLPLGSRP